ncbi:MAG: universal stress protein [Elainellaceae cyanobacterium]
MAFQKILVAIDRSPQSSFVFEKALEQAHEGCEMMITHVVRMETEVPSGSFMGLGTIADVDTYGTLKRAQQERIQKELKHSRDWLQPYYQQAIAKGIITETECRAAEPAVWICDLAKNWEADLIVLGRRGHQGLKEIVLGSVSNYVVHHASCSVLIVQGIAANDTY